MTKQKHSTLKSLLIACSCISVIAGILTLTSCMGTPDAAQSKSPQPEAEPVAGTGIPENEPQRAPHVPPQPHELELRSPAESIIDFALNKRGLASLTAKGLGADGHNFISKQGNPDYKHGTFKGSLRYRKSDGTKYWLSWWPDTRKKRNMNLQNGTLTWRAFDKDGTEAGAFDVTYSKSGRTMIFDLTYTHKHPEDVVYEVGATFFALNPPARKGRWNDISTCKMLNYGSGKLVLASMSRNRSFAVTMGKGVGCGWNKPEGFALEPGDQLSARVELHFLPADLHPMQVADKIYENWRSVYPRLLRSWTDQRPIATAFMARVKSGWKTNPRGYFNSNEVDVTTEAGLLDFRRRLLDYARKTRDNALRLNSQGVIIWDLEGQEHGHPVSYIGDPRLLEKKAPEMEWTPKEPTEDDPYPELCNADAFIKILSDAGLKVGVTVRPQLFSRKMNMGFLSLEECERVLDEKIAYCRERWNMDFVYIDTSLHTNNKSYLPPATYRKIMQKYPDMLLIPEYGRQSLHHAYCAPYGELDRGKTSTHPRHRRTYPNAFSVVNVMQGPREKKRDAIKMGMQNGDILLFMGWWPSPDQKWVAKLMPEVYGPEEALAPDAPRPRYPLHEVIVRHPQPVFRWHPTFDPSGIAQYEVMIDDITYDAGKETDFTPPNSLSAGEHTWKVRAIDTKDNTGEWSLEKTFFIMDESK